MKLGGVHVKPESSEIICATRPCADFGGPRLNCSTVVSVCAAYTAIGCVAWSPTGVSDTISCHVRPASVLRRMQMLRLYT